MFDNNCLNLNKKEIDDYKKDEINIENENENYNINNKNIENKNILNKENTKNININNIDKKSIKSNINNENNKNNKFEENEIILEKDFKNDKKNIENKSLNSNESKNSYKNKTNEKNEIKFNENLKENCNENNIDYENEKLNNLIKENFKLKESIKNLKEENEKNINNNIFLQKENQNIKNENINLLEQLKLFNNNLKNIDFELKNSPKNSFFEKITSEDELLKSKIILKEEIKMLKNWILNTNIKFQLLMNNETSNISVESFHNLCDNKPTLILIKTKENDRIGGFTNLSWKCNEKKRDEFKKDNSTFIFSLDKKQKCFPNKNCYYTIRTFKNDHGPIFGNLELYINKNFTEGNCLNNKKCFKYDEDILNGKIQFKIEIFEIYEII